MKTKYLVIYHYGDTNAEEVMEEFQTLSEAQNRAELNNKKLTTEQYEKGDYYFVKEEKIMNYKETLELAKKENINICDLQIAYELDCQNDNIIPEEEFEFFCHYIKEIWLKMDEHTSLSTITYAVLQEIKNGDLTKEMIIKHADKCDDYDIREIICQCY